MKYYTEYKGHNPNIIGKRKKFDDNIYTFDIETTSYLILNEKIYPAKEYLNFTEKEREECEFCSNMYIWMFSINENVYYGRTWKEFEQFISDVNSSVPDKKIVYVHNLAFEFQYLKSYFNFKSVFARKSRKVMKCELEDYNFEFKCSYMLSGVSLEQLPEIYNLDVEKLVGNLDYTKIRHSLTPLDEKELAYCENDCLVLYKYILKEKETYETVKNIPLTNTGKVRRELKERVEKDYYYKGRIRKAVNTDPHVYNMLLQAFAGGYTHANYLYTDNIIENVDSWDFTSSYPYILVSHPFPASKFHKCNITKVEQMSRRFAYLIKVKFTKIECKYWNNFISGSKCESIENGVYDNGRVMKADELVMTVTDIDFYFFLDTYKYEKYEIIESYNAVYNYLPKKLIEFILEKYVLKTKYKNVEDKKVQYAIQKRAF